MIEPFLMDVENIISGGENALLDFAMDGRLMSFAFLLKTRDEAFLVSLYEVYRKSTAFVEFDGLPYFILRERMAEILAALAMNLRSFVYLDKAVTAFDRLLNERRVQDVPLGKAHACACIVGVHVPFFEDEMDLDLAFASYNIAIQEYELGRFPKNHAILSAWAGILHAWCGLWADSNAAAKRHSRDGLACIQRSQQCPEFENDPRDFDLMASSIDFARDTLAYAKNNLTEDLASRNAARDTRKVYRCAKMIVKDEAKKWGVAPQLDKWCMERSTLVKNEATSPSIEPYNNTKTDTKHGKTKKDSGSSI